MREVLTVILAAIVLAMPTFAGYATAARSIRAIQAPAPDQFGIRTLRNICTATSINADKHYWLTAAHCLIDEELFIAHRRADVMFRDAVADLAVLYTADYALPALKLRQTPPAVDQAVMLIGYPVGLLQVQVFRGRISSLRTEVEDTAYMLFDMTACGGNSGSAVVDARDQVISVLQIGFGPGCSPFSGGAPWETLVRLVGPYFGR